MTFVLTLSWSASRSEDQRKYSITFCEDNHKEDFSLAVREILADADCIKMESVQSWDCDEAQTVAEGSDSRAQARMREENTFKKCFFWQDDFSLWSIPINFLLIKTNIPHLSLFRSYLPVSANSWTPQPYHLSSIKLGPKNNGWHDTIFLTLFQCFLVSRATHKTHVRKSLS